MTNIATAQSVAKNLEKNIKSAQTIQQKTTCLWLGLHFMNATLQRFRVDEELLEDLNYELNKHCSTIDRERIEFLWERFIPLFERVKTKLDAIKKR
jgi:aspartyl-tRNA synthetase